MVNLLKAGFLKITLRYNIEYSIATIIKWSHNCTRTTIFFGYLYVGLLYHWNLHYIFTTKKNSRRSTQFLNWQISFCTLVSFILTTTNWALHTAYCTWYTVLFHLQSPLWIVQCTVCSSDQTPNTAYLPTAHLFTPNSSMSAITPVSLRLSQATGILAQPPAPPFFSSHYQTLFFH